MTDTRGLDEPSFDCRAFCKYTKNQTHAIECGMGIKFLSEILGHKNSTATLNRYVHSLMEHKRAMMDKMGKIF